MRICGRCNPISNKSFKNSNDIKNKLATFGMEPAISQSWSSHADLNATPFTPYKFKVNGSNATAMKQYWSTL